MAPANEEAMPGQLDGLTDFDLFIDGAYASSSTDERIKVKYPYTGEVWATVPAGTGQDVDAAVGSADQAFKSGEWSQLRPSQRRDILYQIGDVISDYADELSELETFQNGKLLKVMRSQIDLVSEYFRYYGRICEEAGSGRTIPVDNKDGEISVSVRKEPYGVVGAITPWNAPLLLTTMKLAPALAAGNTFVHKPSEIAPISSLKLAEYLYENTDLPKGVYNVVTGDGETGAALTDHPGVDKVAFTGSTEVGRSIAKNAGENLSSVSLELGGKSPNIVFPSADVENAIDGILRGIFAATGQSCMAGSRVLLHEDIHDEVVDSLKEKAMQIKLGDPRNPETQMGPLAFKGQAEKVKQYINIGREDGATLVVGGECPEQLPGECFVEPTIFVDAESDMQIAQEEIFGPVATVIPFEDEEEAIDLANDVNFGLAAGVWTEDMRQADRLIKEIRAGTIWINNYRVVAENVPFGGFKDSGLGRENGVEGLEEFCQTKSVWYDNSGTIDSPFQIDTGGR